MQESIYDEDGRAEVILKRMKRNARRCGKQTQRCNRCISTCEHLPWLRSHVQLENHFFGNIAQAKITYHKGQKVVN